MTWPHNLLPHMETCSSTGFPAMAAFRTLDSLAPWAFGGHRNFKAAQACADGASHNDSEQGNLAGSSLKSTAPRRLVKVHRLQSYSKDAQAMRLSLSLVTHDFHSA
ncbi:hypothetical protein J3459_011312 [Metarhizium acridum]|nr:hypothetical protein J3459_011312 [Metarhizium acridum]